MNCVMFCLKSQPALFWPVAPHGPPNWIAGDAMFIAAPLPESAFAKEF